MFVRDEPVHGARGLRRRSAALSALVSAVVTTSLLLGGCSRGGNLEVGLAAYDRKDHAAALKELQPLADRGNPEAQFRLGWMYREGLGLPQSDIEMVRWYQKAAKSGHAAAQYWLGSAYAVGHGVREQPARAVFWYFKAADQGHAASQIELSVALLYGAPGVSKHVPGAYALLVLASTASDEKERDRASHHLKFIKQRLTPLELSEGDALVYSVKSGENSVSKALGWAGLKDS
jgi:TPR repeat protein